MLDLWRITRELAEQATVFGYFSETMGREHVSPLNAKIEY